MKAQQKTLARLMVLVVGMVLCGLPEVAGSATGGNISSARPAERHHNRSVKRTTATGPGPESAHDGNSSPAIPELPPNLFPATPQPQMKARRRSRDHWEGPQAEGMPTVGGAASRPARRGDCSCQAASEALPAG